MDKNLIIAIVVLVFVVLAYVVTLILVAKYGREKIDAAFVKIKEGLNSADTTIHNVSTILPEKVINIADEIIKYAFIVVSAVEQGYKNGAIAMGDRKSLAMEKLTTMLGVAGINVNEGMTPAMDDAVEAAVLQLPKTHVTAKNKKV